MKLFLVSSKADVPYRVCSIPNEVVHGYAVSPDRSLAASVTSTHSNMDDVMGPDTKVFLTLVGLPDCKARSRQELQFPERTQRRAPILAPKNKYWANARFGGRWLAAVSPDNKLLALGYGVRRDGIYSDGEAYFSVYSLATAQRLATTRAGIAENGLLLMLKYLESVPTGGAPLNGALLFSPDLRTLFAGSERIWQWDLKEVGR